MPHVPRETNPVDQNAVVGAAVFVGLATPVRGAGRPALVASSAVRPPVIDGRIDPDEWKAHAPVQQGSWWEAMNAWITARSGEPVPAKAIPPDHVVCDAPGTYVMTRYAD